jgi:hypothetical protein
VSAGTGSIGDLPAVVSKIENQQKIKRFVWIRFTVMVEIFYSIFYTIIGDDEILLYVMRNNITNKQVTIIPMITDIREKHLKFKTKATIFINSR